MDVEKKFVRKEEESWGDFKVRVFVGVNELLDQVEELRLEEEGGQEERAGANEFIEFSVYTQDGKIRDVSIDLVFPDEATVRISEKREATEEERQYFMELAKTYGVEEDFKW